MKLLIQGTLIDLNAYIRLERSNKFAGAETKRKMTDIVAWTAKAKKFRVDFPFLLKITWAYPNRRIDPDNIAFATKFILDGLQLAGAIDNDGWDTVKGIFHVFEQAKSPFIELHFLDAAQKQTLNYYPE